MKKSIFSTDWPEKALKYLMSSPSENYREKAELCHQYIDICPSIIIHFVLYYMSFITDYLGRHLNDTEFMDIINEHAETIKLLRKVMEETLEEMQENN